jgi:hypothetical protein
MPRNAKSSTHRKDRRAKGLAMRAKRRRGPRLAKRDEMIPPPSRTRRSVNFSPSEQSLACKTRNARLQLSAPRLLGTPRRPKIFPWQTPHFISTIRSQPWAGLRTLVNLGSSQAGLGTAGHRGGNLGSSVIIAILLPPPSLPLGCRLRLAASCPRSWQRPAKTSSGARRP